MPIQCQPGKTPSGRSCMIAKVFGQVTLADAESMGTFMMEPGSPFYGGLIFCDIAKGTEYSPDSRKYFSTMQGKYKRMSAVVPSAVVRAAINFMLRLTKASMSFRMFEREAEAMAWLDEAAD